MNIKTYLNGYVISTVSFPFPDCFGYSFETMIFNEETLEFLQFQERYKNCTSAFNGHIRTIRNLQEILYKEGK